MMFKNIFSSAIILSFIFSASSHEIRLDIPGSSMEYIKSRTQISHICYAHAAADMIDSYRFFFNKDDRYQLRTSPLSLAIKSSMGVKLPGKRQSPATFFELGQICNAVRAAFKFGINDFKEVDAHIFKSNKKMEEQNMSYKTSDDYDETRSQFNLYFKELFSRYLGSGIKVKRRGFVPFLKHWLAKQSPESHKIISQGHKKPKCRVMQFGEDMMNSEDDKIYYKIIRHFERNTKALPIGIDFCHRYFETGEIGRIGQRTQSGKSCLRHAATIIGLRTMPDNSKQVLVKNTFPCELMDKKFECQDNKVWAPFIELIQSSKAIHYFEF